MKRILLYALLVIMLSISVYPQIMILRRSTLYYDYQPITGLAITAEDGIRITNELIAFNVIRSDSSTRLPASGWSWVRRYEHSVTNLSDSTLVADSTNGSVRNFDVSMYPIGSQFEYRYSLLQTNIIGAAAYKTDTVIIYNVEELPGHPLYTADGYPVFDAQGLLLYPAD